MESWKKVLIDGFLPVMKKEEIEALLKACIEDDVRLLQGCTTQPPPLMCVQDWPCEGGCALGYSAWQGGELETVGEVEERFAALCFYADQRLGEPAACRWFLNWFDDTSREEVRKELIPVLENYLASA